MILEEILTKLVEKEAAILLNDGVKDWEPADLLENLSIPKLKQPAHFQAGLYIAEINNGGYLGEVLYKIKEKV